MSDADKSDVQWIQDSGGVTTCHINTDTLNFQDSLIGRLSYVDSVWSVILADGTVISPKGGCGSLAQARALLENHFRKGSKAVDKKHVRVAQTGRV